MNGKVNGDYYSISGLYMGIMEKKMELMYYNRVYRECIIIGYIGS